jgi:hypothetical protein
MKRHFAIRELLIASAVSFVLSGLFAGTPEERPCDYTIRSDVRLVLLDVSVKARKGSFVSGYQKKTSLFLKTAGGNRLRYLPTTTSPP